MSNEWTNKCWGKTRELIGSELYSRYELELIAGGYCSIHYHRSRANRFLVVSGAVQIVEFFGSQMHKRMLGPDNSYDVASLVPHMFIVYRPGLMIEEYYPDRGGVVDRGDIVRLAEGGRVADPEMAELDVLPKTVFAKIDV